MIRGMSVELQSMASLGFEGGVQGDHGVVMPGGLGSARKERLPELCVAMRGLGLLRSCR